MSDARAGLGAAFSKAIFCLQHASGIRSKLRILRNTKRFRRHMHTGAAVSAGRQAVPYRVRFFGLSFTLWLRTYSGDLQIFYEVFWEQVYAVPGLDLGHVQTVVDLGGNVGLSALFFGLQAPGARLIVVEPDAENFELLKQNLRPLGPRATALRAAAHHSDGALFLHQSRFAYNSHTAAEGKGHSVAALSINRLLKQCALSRIDLLKIDIEGAEQTLFSAHTEWLSHVQHIVIEIHSAEAFGVCSPVLQQYGFSLRCLSGKDLGAGIFYACRPAGASV